MEQSNTNTAKSSTGLPRVGYPAPRFEAVTTLGSVCLEDYKGSWLVFFSHPADFTPVCTTEIIAFAGLAPRLKSLGCELLGLSIDSVYSHIAWIRAIEEKARRNISFPIIADADKAIATLYGMIMPGESATATARCVFIIDDNQTLRAMLCYPISTGRNTEEIIRLVQALQICDAQNVCTPANWKPGEQVLLPPPATQEIASKRMKDGKDPFDWYYCTTDPENP